MSATLYLSMQIHKNNIDYDVCDSVFEYSNAKKHNTDYDVCDSVVEYANTKKQHTSSNTPTARSVLSDIFLSF